MLPESSRIPLRIVLTGGAYAGKTTLAAQLASRDTVVVPEAAIEVISELCAEHGLEGQARWRAANVIEFQRRIAAAQQQAELCALRSGASCIIFDRGLPDGLAYFRQAEVDPPDDLRGALTTARYDAVLVLDTLSDFQARAATGRLDDRASSLRLGESLFGVYRELGHAPVRVPELPVSERVEWVRTHLRRRAELRDGSRAPARRS